MSSDPFDQIRAACRLVAERARAVRIERGRLPAYASALAREPLQTLRMDPEIHLLGAGDATLAFILTVDAVNFGSGYFADLLPPGHSGYRFVAGALTDRFRRDGPFPAAELARMTAADCFRIFPLDPGRENSAELMELFALAWRELGELVGARFAGRFERLVSAADGWAGRLIEILGELPSFRDEAEYRGITVPFYKRAQITVADLHIAFDGVGPGHFRDVDRLTIFADNLVPHVLRCDGILHYSDALAARIDGGEAIPAGSSDEVEIRACAVHAAELLIGELRSLGVTINSLQLDNFLWHRGQQPAFRLQPRHRTRTLFY